ncbi:DNA-processing protein DprA [Halopseudomonas phragmitis]|uniref:DNA protecting protein DprA n=2 Tax=Pseudomonadaceae TaxID=135621 RepID=A0A1V0B2B3_9GAMM|nr:MULTISPECIES: DNA-processing protein DprA [Pseudomonadaceae]AQZ94076.1 DNA protecting protein DprA [Halopseudomonas phragmitis]RHW20814.1 DNA-protecting protein DprA [Pseudomonas jilinensis]
MTSLSPARHEAWLTLALLEGLGARSLRRLFDVQPDPVALLSSTPSSLKAMGMSPRALEALLRLRAGQDQELKQRLALAWQWSEQPGQHVLCLGEPDYPELLRQIADPPAVLFVRGNPALLQDPQLAMVGTRHPSPRGAATAREFASAFAASGLCVTSGMALGIDGACHQGALEAGGHTVAVWGTGLDCCYPKRHAGLAETIVASGGALVSAFWPDTKAQPGQFPSRNRVISGLSLGTLVVEASLNSGSLITARLALEQNREVFAMPGSIHNPQARGCHRLLRDGAHLVETVNDVLRVLHQPLCQALQPSEDPRRSDNPLWRWLDNEPVSVDWLSEQSGQPVHVVLQRLMDLELEGLVLHGPAGYCRRPA